MSIQGTRADLDAKCEELKKQSDEDLAVLRNAERIMCRQAQGQSLNRIDIAGLSICGTILIGILVACIFLGCVKADGNKTGINDSPVTVATTMPVTLYTEAQVNAKVEAAVKAALQSYENKQQAQSGRDTYQINNTVAGSGGIFLMLAIVVLGRKLSTCGKVVKFLTEKIEMDAPFLKRIIGDSLGNDTVKKWLKKRCDKWFPKKPNGSTAARSPATTAKSSK
jgi:hypothetical protein